MAKVTRVKKEEQETQEFQMLRRYHDCFLWMEDPRTTDLEPYRGIVQDISHGGLHVMPNGNKPGREISVYVSYVKENSHRWEWRDRCWWAGSLDVLREHRPNVLEAGDWVVTTLEDGFRILDERAARQKRELEEREARRKAEEEMVQKRRRIQTMNEQGIGAAEIAKELNLSGEEVAQEIAIIADVLSRR